MTAYPSLGLVADPFDPATTDPAPFYRTLGHEDCLERLHRAIHDQSGLALVLGEDGFGKSTIRTALLHSLREEWRITPGLIADPRQCRTDVQFLRAILAEFDLPANGRSALDLISALKQFLNDRETPNQQLLLVIDEGHHLTSAQLEIVRTLLSFDPEGDLGKRVAVVIFARPEIEEKVRRKRNLAARLTMTHTLNPLNRRDTAALIAHRLAVAGHCDDAPRLFTDEAIEAISNRTGGVPSAIIAASHACLAEAVALDRTTVDAALAARVSAIAIAQQTTPGGEAHRSRATNGRHAPADGPIQTRIPLLISNADHAGASHHGGAK
jgi:type II secretory pathway predicted ATPase ExeA